MDEIRAKLFDAAETPDLTVFSPLPAGQHLLEVIDVKSGTAQSTGRGRLGLQVKIVGGEHDGEKGWYNLNLSEDKDPIDGYIRKLWKKLAEVLPEVVQTTAEGDQTIKPNLFKGVQFRANVIVGEFEGKKRNEFKNEVWLGFSKKTPEAPPMA